MLVDGRTKLLVEPIVLPSLSHLSIDEISQSNRDSFFYPDGSKKVNMRKDLEKTVQAFNAPTESLLSMPMDDEQLVTLVKTRDQAKSADFPSSRKKKNLPSKGFQREPLFYSKKPDKEVGVLLKEVREQECELKGLLVPRFM